MLDYKFKRFIFNLSKKELETSLAQAEKEYMRNKKPV